MDQGLPHRRRKARAIAISQTLDARRQAAVAKILLALTSMAVVIEALAVAQTLWMASHA